MSRDDDPTPPDVLDPRAEEALRDLRAWIDAQPDPSAEELIAYVDGGLSGQRRGELELLITARPALRVEVEGLASPDPALVLASKEAMAQVLSQSQPAPVGAASAFEHKATRRSDNSQGPQSRAPRRFWRAGVAALATLMAVVVIWRQVGTPEPVAGAQFRFGDGTRAGGALTSASGEPVTTLLTGEAVKIELSDPGEGRCFALFEITGRSVVEVPAETPCHPPLTLYAGAEPGVRFLVLVATPGAVPDPGIQGIVIAEAQRGDVLFDQSLEDRTDRLNNALRSARPTQGGDLRVDVSGLYQTRSR